LTVFEVQVTPKRTILKVIQFVSKPIVVFHSLVIYSLTSASHGSHLLPNTSAMNAHKIMFNVLLNRPSL